MENIKQIQIKDALKSQVGKSIKGPKCLCGNVDFIQLDPDEEKALFFICTNCHRVVKLW